MTFSIPSVKLTPEATSHQIKKILLLALGILIFSLAEAQSDFRPGYIVTLEGDTINGLINLRGTKANSESCIFRRGADSEKVRYMPDQILAYRFLDGRGFISSASSTFDFNDEVFLEYVAEGPLTIFYYKDNGNEEHFLASKDTVTMELIYQHNASEDSEARSKFQKYKGQLRYLLGDQPTLFPLIDKITCHKKDLKLLAKEYKKLVHPLEEPKISGRKKSIRFKLALQLSGGISHLSSPPYNMYLSDYLIVKSLNFERSLTYEIGSTVNVYLDYTGRNRLCLQFSPALNRVEYTSKVERTLPPLIYIYELDVKYTTLRVPLLIKYSFNSSNRSVSPFVKGGPGIAIYMTQRGRYQYHSTPMASNSSEPDIYIQSLNSNEKSAKAYLVAGAGIDAKLNNKLVSLGALYSYGVGQLDGYRTDIQLQLEYQF